LSTRLQADVNAFQGYKAIIGLLTSTDTPTALYGLQALARLVRPDNAERLLAERALEPLLRLLHGHMQRVAELRQQVSARPPCLCCRERGGS